MVFYESFMLVHGRYPVLEKRLLLREASRVIVDNDGVVFRIIDLGWRHTAQPVRKKRVGVFHYGQWFSFTWGGPPSTVQELSTTCLHSTGVLRFKTTRIDGPANLQTRSTFYPMLVPNDSVAGLMEHHTPMKPVE
eukprot:TRINITY_DN61158_c0_g1_i1.p1 TRINITY_DN61158_c0_g1~~TRINITY_DN61158_c0_g1_i1.p1  ORF type:complete len:157 (+),score=11.50 TRINITY_DN61158_c0_g1_i1:67-471(+)